VLLKFGTGTALCRHLQCFSPEVHPWLASLDYLLFYSARLTVALTLLSLIICTPTELVNKQLSFHKDNSNASSLDLASDQDSNLDPNSDLKSDWDSDLDPNSDQDLDLNAR